MELSSTYVHRSSTVQALSTVQYSDCIHRVNVTVQYHVAKRLCRKERPTVSAVQDEEC